METLIYLLCYYEKVFIVMNTWIAGKNFMKHHNLIKKAFYNELNLEDITD